jgi:hypothetical protein
MPRSSMALALRSAVILLAVAELGIVCFYTIYGNITSVANNTSPCKHAKFSLNAWHFMYLYSLCPDKLGICIFLYSVSSKLVDSILS